jgi:hypothetical protein
MNRARTATLYGIHAAVSILDGSFARIAHARASSVDISFEHKYTHTTVDFNIKQIIVIPRK